MAHPPRYLARYLDPASMAICEAHIDAPDEAGARAQLAADGKQLLSLKPVNRWRVEFFSRHAAPTAWSAAEIALFCRELRALTGAGLSVVEALEALAAQQHEQQSAPIDDLSIYTQLLTRLQAGRSLSSAMADVGGLPPLLIASVQSSERTSNLGEALEAYLRYDELVSLLRRRVVSAALYPAIVVSLGLLISVFLVWVVIPRFAVLYGQMGQGAGGVTHALLQLSRVLHDAPWLVPVGLLTLALLGWLGLGSGRWRGSLRWVIARVPLLVRQARHFELARLFEALALLIRGGFSFHESLELCKGIAQSDAARYRIASAQEQVSRGVSVSRACATAELTDSVTERLLRASERGGDFAGVLQAIGQRHSGAFETFIERATRVVEPMLLLGVALLVGGMVVLLYMPIFDIASSIR